MGRSRLRETDKAYIAGFLDGEGTITCTVKEGRWPSLRVLIYNTDQRVLQWMLAHYDGSVRPHSGWEDGQKRVYAFAPTVPARMRLLKEILPYLKLKRSQAMIGIRMLELTHGQGLDERRQLAMQLHALNRRGSTSHARP